VTVTRVAPRRKWPWILAAIVIIAALITAAFILGGARRGTVTPVAAPTRSGSAGPSATADREPTGCLGGAERAAATVVAAQRLAPHSSNGAVEVAAVFTRWIQRFPYPSAAEAGVISKNVLASKSFTSNLTEYLSAGPDLSGGIVPQGTNYYMSTIPGVWHLESAAADRVVASIGTGFVIDGELSTTLRSSITVTLDWQDGKWKIADAVGQRTTENLYSVGNAFTKGC
jgi:hypothetical protein